MNGGTRLANSSRLRSRPTMNRASRITWTAANLSNANFRVRVTNVADSTSRDFSLDWIAVRVTHSVP
jgi:hypothetical protein